jgi:dienelactone hydrolase
VYLVVLLASLVASSAVGGQRTATQSFPRGQLLDVASGSGAGQRFAVYLPTGYDPARPAPVIYLLDPRGRARVPAALFQPAAERFGYILVSSYNSVSDGQAQPNLLAMQAMWRDTHDWFAVDDRRVYIAGFSGTARTACLIAHHMPDTFTGVIGAGAGFHPDYPPSKQTKFLYFGTAGSADYNFYEMWKLDERLASLDLGYRIEGFDGAHSWMTPELAARAVEWFELRSMQRGSRPRDEALIEAWWRRDESAARALAAGGRALDASRRYAALARDYAGLRETAAAAADASELSKSPEARRQLEQRQRARKLASIWTENAMLAIAEAFKAGTDTPAVPAADLVTTLEVARLKKAASGPDAEAALEARRRLHAIEVQVGFYLPREAIEHTEYERAAYYLAIAVQMDDASPVSWFLTGVVRARLREPRQAIAALARAVDAGYRDLARLESEPAFLKLRTDPAFQALVERVRAAGDSPPTRGIDRLPPMH